MQFNHSRPKNAFLNISAIYSIGACDVVRISARLPILLCRQPPAQLRVYRNPLLLRLLDAADVRAATRILLARMTLEPVLRRLEPPKHTAPITLNHQFIRCHLTPACGDSWFVGHWVGLLWRMCNH